MTEGSAKAPEQIAEQRAAGKTDGTLPFMTTRRSLLRGICSFLSAFGLAGVVYGIYRFLAPGGGTQPAVEISLSAISASGAYSFQYGGSPGILIQEEDGSLRAFSLICTHMACTVNWNPDKKEFHCPCHDALFDAQGNVLSGPAPSPLERWRVEVKNDRILVGGA